MGFSDLLQALGMGLRGETGQQGGNQQGGRQSPFANWTQDNGAGLASATPPPLAGHSSTFQGIFSAPSMQQQPMQMGAGGGLAALLQRLGIFH